MTATAEPLPEKEILELFNNAPQDQATKLNAPIDVSTLFKQRLMRVIGEKKQILLGIDLAASLLAIALIISGSVALGILVFVVLFIGWIIFLSVQYKRGKSDFFLGYAASRGLEVIDDDSVPTLAVPLMRSGDKRKCEQKLTGKILGVPATLANYTYTEVSTDSDGNRTESDFKFLILHLQFNADVADRYKGVLLSPKKFSLAKLGDVISKYKTVELESTDFHKRYTLRTDKNQDEIALYELFSTTFIDQLTTGPNITWEQVGADIVFYRKKHETESADLDRFVADAAPVVKRYREEFQ